MVGVWINHHDKNIYFGTWKFVGKRTINLVPYGEKIVFFDKHDIKKIDVVNYHHILNKK